MNKTCSYYYKLLDILEICQNMQEDIFLDLSHLKWEQHKLFEFPCLDLCIVLEG